MRKLILLLFSVGIIKSVTAQVIVTLQLPQVGITVKSQLWNMTLVNSGTATVAIKINMILTDAGSGQQILSGSTNLLDLPQGAKLIQYNDVVPINYTVFNNSYNIDSSPNGFLPIGNFIVCFEVLKKESEYFESMVEECQSIEVEPVSPPYLNLPEDQSEFEESKPLFTWIPPSPAILFNNLTYDFKLTEILPGQSNTEAIQQNIPLLTQQNVSTPTLQYPSSSSGLDTGKVYAWQVTAKNNNTYIANSEVWQFKVIKAPFTGQSGESTIYIKLKREYEAPFMKTGEALKFEYQNELNDSTVAIHIYDLTLNNRQEVSLVSQIQYLSYGQNFIDIDLKEIAGIRKDHIYLFELVNSKKEKWCLKFESNKAN